MSGGATKAPSGHGFDFLSDPILVVSVEGRILESNAAADAFFGSQLADGNLVDIAADDAGVWKKFLRSASGSTSPRPGKLSFVGETGKQHLVVQAARSKFDGIEPQIVLRLLSPSSDRFAMLDRRVKELDTQLLEKLRRNAELQEALRQNRLLLRELQHRVKNNIQLIMALTKISASGYEAPEVGAVIEILRGRLHAMAAVQEALYQAAEVETVMARGFLQDVVSTTARASGAASAVSLSLDDAALSSNEAHALALIANELVTNAAKHGLRGGQGNIRVTFSDTGSDYRFEVQDDGTGYSGQTAARSSGLSLVRGLCRQIGGRLEIDGNEGTRCSVVFRAEEQRKSIA